MKHFNECLHRTVLVTFIVAMTTLAITTWFIVVSTPYILAALIIFGLGKLFGVL